MRKRVDAYWKSKFSDTLKRFLSWYGIDYKDFCKIYNYSESTVRYWMIGRNLPSCAAMRSLGEYLSGLAVCGDREVDFHHELEQTFEDASIGHLYWRMCAESKCAGEMVAKSLKVFWELARGDHSYVDAMKTSCISEGVVKAVVLDFDGTLTLDRGIDATTWELLWDNLGLGIKNCQALHRRFDASEITHAEWCLLTQQQFILKGLEKKQVEELGKSVQLLPGVAETFQELSDRDIRIYIVSGSIYDVIKMAMGSTLRYVDEVQCNRFKYDKKGRLSKIVGTHYDFRGKAAFIVKKADELGISAQDILFVGNSINDRFAYLSGAKTLCINPKITDPTDSRVWNDWIQTCDDLRDILRFV